MGVASVPNMKSDSFWGSALNSVVSALAQFKVSQNLVGPAGYFKDPKNYNRYLEKSDFLADLNNERPQKNNAYVERMKKLDKVLLIKFDRDTMTLPAETAHFEFQNSNGQIVPLEKSDFYVKDYLGIRWLNEKGRLERKTLSGAHLQFGYWDIQYTFAPFLKE